jgi:hypothetical protein
MKNTFERFAITLFLLLLCHLKAAEDQPSIYQKYPGFFELLDRGRSGTHLFVEGEPDRKAWDDYFKENPEIIDRYIKEGARMQEVMNYISQYSEYRGLNPKTVANLSLRDYVRFFSRDLAYYDPVLSEGKKKEAAQALISALKARPFISPPENHLGEQSDPLVAVGFSYLLSPWRHRPEVIEYIKSVEFTDRVVANKAFVEQLMLLHNNVSSDVRYVPRTLPRPGIVFPIHPASKAREEAATQREQEQTQSSPAANTAPEPAPEPPSPIASVPSSVPAAPSTKTSRAVWWILGTLAGLGAAVLIRRRQKTNT